MSNLVTHAENEFKILDWPGNCEMQKMACDNIIELLTAFSDQGHSGSSALYVLNLFSELAKFNPISPLTGEKEEWNKIGSAYQNKRDSEVFKESLNGSAYWIKGKIFRNKEGSTYTNKESHINIKFPWRKPNPEIVDVDD